MNTEKQSENAPIDYPRLVRLRGGRPQDLDIFIAIKGREPVIAPDVVLPDDQPQPLGQILQNWSPQLLLPVLRKTVIAGFAMQARRPQVAAFIRRVTDSAVRQVAGNRRFVDSSEAPRTKVAAGVGRAVERAGTATASPVADKPATKTPAIPVIHRALPARNASVSKAA